MAGRIETLNIAQPDHAQAFTAALAEVDLEDRKPPSAVAGCSSPFTGLLSEETVQASF